MDAWETIMARRQVRAFTHEALRSEDLDRILEAGRRAPSSRNTQPWDFVLVTDKDTVAALSETWRGAGWIAGSAATIAVLIPDSSGDPSPSTWFDLGLVGMQMLIAATALGIGSGQASCHDQELARSILGFPDDRRCGLFIALGHPADRPLRPIRNPARRDFDDVVHRERW